MAGPVYHFDPRLKSRRKLPAEFDGAVFLYEWERGWIKAVRLDEVGQVQRLMPLLGEAKFKRPISLQLGPDGALYVLEWGSRWSDNADSALIRIEATGD